MRAINHALTGAAIGLSVGNPVIALPLAFVSHFVCDAMPHFGVEDSSRRFMRSKTFALLLVADALLCIALVGLLAITQPTQWFWAAAAAFLAASPDLFWMPGWLRARRGKQFVVERANWFMLFAKRIQWFERPSGAIIEMLWFVAFVGIIITYL